MAKTTTMIVSSALRIRLLKQHQGLDILLDKEEVQDALENVADVLYGDTIQKNQLCRCHAWRLFPTCFKGDSAAGHPVLMVPPCKRMPLAVSPLRQCLPSRNGFVVRNFPRAEALLASFKGWSMCDAETLSRRGCSYFHHGHLFPHGEREHRSDGPRVQFLRVPNVSLGAWLAQMRDDRMTVAPPALDE